VPYSLACIRRIILWVRVWCEMNLGV